MGSFENQQVSMIWDNLIEVVDQKSAFVGSIACRMLLVGASAFRVREAMNKVSKALDITCNANIGLLSIDTGGIDLAKLDIRSGFERICYSVLIIIVAALTGWLCAFIFHFYPQNFDPFFLNPRLEVILQVFTSFIAIYGYLCSFAWIDFCPYSFR